MNLKMRAGQHAGRQSGLRRFIVSWLAVLMCGFLLLGGGLYLSIAKLHTQMARIYFDSQSLRTNHLLESDVLAAGRFTLLDQVAPGQNHRVDREAKLSEALTLVDKLQADAQGEREQRLAAEIVRCYHAFSQSLRLNVPQDFGQQERLDELLEALLAHRKLNQQQMEATLSDGDRLNRLVDFWAMGIVLLTAATLIAGAVELWRRIFRPTLELERAARAFGDGDLQSRARVLRDDEMGKLVQTFNSMAAAICDREKDRLRFVATVAHDLKNPLVVIGGAAHLLERKELNLDAEQRKTWLGKIARNALKLEDMIGDLTDAVQIETGQIMLRREEFDLAALATTVVGEHAEAVKTHSLCCEAPLPCLVNADRRRVERVLSNLISNAVKYSSEGREVQVNVSTLDGQALLTVRDQGVGIAPHELETLFRPFARLERTENMAKGTGLGLSSVKKIVEAHGGTVEVQSQINEGTTVIVKIPLANETQS